MNDYTVWRPLTKLAGSEEPLQIESAEGPYLQLKSGRKLIDGISSWWINTLGHSNEAIADAIAAQSRIIDQVPLADFIHKPVRKLSDMLGEKLHKQDSQSHLNHFFYSDDGSTAVEVALKMTIQYWKNSGRRRNRFIAFEGAFHGDTFGAMSVGSRSIFNRAFQDHLFEIDYIPFPATFEEQKDEVTESKEEHALNVLKDLLEENQEEYAGIILEPLVQGASGMNMCRPSFLRKLQGVTDAHGLLQIYDEVFTGFGRTGEWFAFQKAGTAPDLICLSKSMTGGALPLAVTAVNRMLYEAFVSEKPEDTFWHGHTYSANPIACAAANANLEQLEMVQNRFAMLESLHREHSQSCRDLDGVEKFRTCGSIAALEISTSGAAGYLNKVGEIVKRNALESGLYLRPLGNVVYLVLPYNIDEGLIEEIYKLLYQTLKKTLETVQQ